MTEEQKKKILELVLESGLPINVQYIEEERLRQVSFAEVKIVKNKVVVDLGYKAIKAKIKDIRRVEILPFSVTIWLYDVKILP